MAQMTRPRFAAVETLDGFRMKLTFVNGTVFTVDFTQFFSDSPGLLPLKDPEEFARATIAPGEGWTVEWVERDIQIGADTLWLDAQAQNAPDESIRFFAGWRARYGLGLKQAAEALGVTPRTISAYSNGSRPIPKTVRLACIGWETLKKAA